MHVYQASEARYENMLYRKCGWSGLKLSAVGLGLWHGFGAEESHDDCFTRVATAFDLGITHFDLADNYGPPPGAAETVFGTVLGREFKAHRDELVVATKAGHAMWRGPYGDWGSRKHLRAGLDQSLQRLRLDYVDIFYHHRPDLETPLEETLCTLADMVDQGKALYIGLSKYPAKLLRHAVSLLTEMRVPCVVHQVRYNLLERGEVEQEQIPAAAEAGLGTVVFSPLAQGVLTNKYADGVPEGSRAAKGSPFIERYLHDEAVAYARRLQVLSKARGQTPAQTALAWVLRDPRITSAVIGASRPEQICENVEALKNLSFDVSELKALGGASTQ
ncbi:MAG: aldo/keto reductase [bacterium]